MNVEKIVLHKESMTLEHGDERDLEYIKQSILSEIKKIDMQRLKSNRYTDSNINEEENFSLKISQFMYKVDNLSQKFEKSLITIEKSLVDLAPPEKSMSQSESQRNLLLQNQLLQEKINDLENLHRQSHKSLSIRSMSPYDEKSNDRQVLGLKEIHATEIKHLQTSHEKIVYELKELSKQKEQRLQERIDMLSTHSGYKDLHIVRDLQGALDKIRAITKPIYDQKVRDFPDFSPLKSERLEVMYADFTVFLAKQAIVYFNKLEDVNYKEDEFYIERDYDEEDVRSQSPRQPFGRNSSYPSVTNLLGGHNDKNHFKNTGNSPALKSIGGTLSITDDDLQKALRIQQEFTRQHELLSREISPHKIQKPVEKENVRHNPGTVSVPNFAPYQLSQRELSRNSLHTDIRDTIHSQRNIVFQDPSHFVTLSQDHPHERLSQSKSKDFSASQNIKSLQKSAKIAPQSSSSFKTKFSHLFHKKKI